MSDKTAVNVKISKENLTRLRRSAISQTLLINRLLEDYFNNIQSIDEKRVREIVREEMNNLSKERPEEGSSPKPQSGGMFLLSEQR